MAQKSKPARKVSSNSAPAKPAAKKAAVKKSAEAKSAPAKSASAKSAPEKANPAKAAAKAKGKSSPAAAVEKPAAQQIAKAKAALKKESASAEQPAAAKAEGKRSRKITIDVNPGEAATALSSKWNTLYKKAEQIEAKPYNMKAVFEEKTAITHKVLGWGYILANRNDRLEVLFKDGIKYLISNYKP